MLTNPGDFGSKFQPDWSPDGTKILFTWSLGQQDVHVINVDGSGETNLTPDTIGSDQRDGVWSPDGAQFAFTDTRFWSIPDFNTEIFVRSADGTGEIQVTDHPSIDDEPTWSPDGTEIAFSSARGGSFDIWSVPVPAGGGTALLEAGGAGHPDHLGLRRRPRPELVRLRHHPDDLHPDGVEGGDWVRVR